MFLQIYTKTLKSLRDMFHIEVIFLHFFWLKIESLRAWSIIIIGFTPG